jgi:cellulose synthase/poly-beta-1,6-N-acetylglucosamine synthase-like glycosyltransferase
MSSIIASEPDGSRVSRRPQFGCDRDTRPHSVLPPLVSERRIAVGQVAVVVTLLAWAAFASIWLLDEIGGKAGGTTRLWSALGMVIVTLFTASSLAYLVSRLGFFTGARSHRRIPRLALDEFFEPTSPSLTCLVPSYSEEPRVVRNTLLSAALQEYPGLRVVLLVDDPPNPTDPVKAAALRSIRELVSSLSDLLAEPGQRFARALAEFEKGDAGDSESLLSLAAEYDWARGWIEHLADDIEIEDHTDEFFVENVLLKQAADYTIVAEALRAAAREEASLPRERLLALHRRLAWSFSVRLSSFERKRYVSLCHDANKAMNLNSYLGLMGGSYREVQTSIGLVLERVDAGQEDIEIPDPDYVLTLDADSIILPEYCARLIYLMEQVEHSRVAVAQTPYRAYPGSATRLERIAGATTDLQYIVHQGMSRHQAGFWVGANAILRKRALEEICHLSHQGNFEIRRYIQDRTLIEDTESSIDLRIKGWSIFNYPESLAYSATPPDFGSLCIQRRRWANGGLLLLHGLWNQRKAMKARRERLSISELLLRLNYTASIAWCSVGLIVLLLADPSGSQTGAALLGGIALPYFVSQGIDLKFLGYRRFDTLRIYGFNVLLLPVNLAGVANSILQGVTGEKSTFGRTPKVFNRTIPNLTFILAPYAVLALAGWEFHRYSVKSDWVAAGYALVNTLFTAYAVISFIGLKNSVHDAAIQLKARLYVPVKVETSTPLAPAAVLACPPEVHWPDVLGGAIRPELSPVPVPDAAVDEPVLVPVTALAAQVAPQGESKVRPSLTRAPVRSGDLLIAAASA